MRVCKVLACLLFSGLLTRADTLPTLSATAFDFTLDIFTGPVLDNTFTASGNGFSLFSDFDYDSLEMQSPSIPINVYAAGLLLPTEGLSPSVLGMFGSAQAVYFGPGGRVAPNDPADYSISNVPGTYSFAATVAASFVACTPPADLGLLVCAPYDASTLPADWTGGYVNVNLPGIETVTSVPYYNSIYGYLEYTDVEIAFHSSPVPEPDGRSLAGLGTAIVMLGWRWRTKLVKPHLKVAA